jgi:predicted ATPase
MLKRLHVKGYKSLSDLEITLQPLSVLFGANAAGKSNLLDLLQLLSRMVTSRTLKEAFEPPYRGKPLESFTFGPDGIRGLLAKQTISFTVEADVELSRRVIESVDRQIADLKRGSVPGDPNKGPSGGSSLTFVREKYLRYRIEVEVLPKSGFLRVADEYLAALNTNGLPTGRRKPFLEKVRDRLHLRMEGQAHPTYHDRYLDHSVLSLPLYPPHYPHLVALRQELASWHFFYFEPRERMRAPNPVKEVRHIGLMGEELAAYLNTLRASDEAQFKALQDALRLVIPSVEGVEVEPNDIGEVELRLLEEGIAIPARILSEGTLRALGLLALFAGKETPALIGFEEPENGIHPRRIRTIAEVLKTRASKIDTQLIVTTHSPTLVDLIPNEFLYVCQKKKGRTSIVPFSTWGSLARSRDIDKALDEFPVSGRIMRGDFDA